MKRQCTKCGKTKELEAFCRRKGAKDGHRSECKNCHCLAERERRRLNGEKMRLRDKSRYQNNPDRRHFMKEKSTVWAKQNSNKRHAHKEVERAISKGLLRKPDFCSLCKEKARKIDGHHPDYDEPLEVVWLCCRCHSRVHRTVKL